LPAANVVVLAWLAAAALTAAAVEPLGMPAWLPVHMFLLGAVGSAILIWSEHFAVAVLHARQPARPWATAQLAALSMGTIAVIGPDWREPRHCARWSVHSASCCWRPR
jgi:nitrite reductase (NO-forming)